METTFMPDHSQKQSPPVAAMQRLKGNPGVVKRAIYRSSIKGYPSTTVNNSQEGLTKEKGEHKGDDPMSNSVEPLFAGSTRLIRWGNTNASGMTLTLSIIDDSSFQVHPLKGLKAATDSEKMNGQRLYVALTSPNDDFKDSSPLYRGDGILIWWSDDCRHGMKFTLRLREGPDGAGSVHPCFGMDAGTKNGETLVVAIWGLDDDETIEDPRPKRTRKKFSELNPTQQAQILCRDHRFQQWLSDNTPDFFSKYELDYLTNAYQEGPAKFAEMAVKIWCNIESRSEISREVEALSKWKSLLDKYNNR